MEKEIHPSRTRSIDNLIRLYTIIISLTITNALSKIISYSDDKSDILILWSNTPQLISLIFTIVPFYHGASRYLDVVYVFEEIKIANKAALMIDFVILFFEGIIFFTLSTIIHNQIWFYGLFWFLLFVDTVWVGWTGLISSEKKWPNYGKWALINLCTVLIYISILYSNIWNFLNYPYLLPISLAGTSILRTVADYIITFNFYFPNYKD